MPERHQQSREYYGFQATASRSEPPVLDRLSSAGSALTGGQFSVRGPILGPTARVSPGADYVKCGWEGPS